VRLYSPGVIPKTCLKAEMKAEVFW
jgi:hypothetical protein